MQKQLSSDVIINHLRKRCQKAIVVRCYYFKKIFQVILIVIEHAFFLHITTVFWIPHSHVLSSSTLIYLEQTVSQT